MSTPRTGAEMIRYVGYDTKTGRIVHTHSEFSVADDQYVEIPVDQLKARFAADPLVVAKLTDGDPANLDFIRADGTGPLRSVVDPVNRRLAAPPRLVLAADRTELAGDGQDSVDLAITVVDEDGRVIEGASGPVKVETSRGKLSARSGLADLADGRASITLTSVDETVSRVQVRASLPGQPCLPARLVLEFS
jgi:hypothetical protein